MLISQETQKLIVGQTSDNETLAALWKTRTQGLITSLSVFFDNGTMFEVRLILSIVL
jgi:hypothetical protein